MGRESDDLQAQQAAWDEMNKRPAESRQRGHEDDAVKTERWLKTHPRPTS